MMSPSPRGWQRVPTTTLQILTAALLAGLMGRAGSMQFPVIPEPAQMSPLIICCVGSLALPAPCLSLHSTGSWRGAQSHKAEPLQPPPMAGPTCLPPSARPLPVSGRIPPASCSLGILSFPKHQFHARIPPATSLLPEDAQSPGQAVLLGWEQTLPHPGEKAVPTGPTDTPSFAGGVWSTTQQRFTEQGADNQPR